MLRATQTLQNVTRQYTRDLPRHRTAMIEFTDFAVDVILQRLSERRRSPVSSEYSDGSVQTELARVLRPLSNRHDIDPDQLAWKFAYRELDSIVTDCAADANRYPIQDPALESLDEVFYASNGFWATVAYRVANSLLRLGVPILPRTISGIAHSRTGIDIHPGTTIAPGLFIDHGTGIAIGCTAVIGRNVNLYNGVVLGTRSKPRRKVESTTGEVQKRHPTIGNGVTIYTSAFVGGDVLIGDGSTVGAFAFVCRDIDPDTVVPGKVDEHRHH